MLLKKIFLFLLIFLIFSKSKSADYHKELLNRLESLYPIEINFEQTNNNNEMIKGWMVLGGKGLARTEFAPPNNLIIVSDSKWIIFHDALYDRTTYLPINKGLFQALLNPSKTSKSIKIVKKIKDNLVIFKITLKQTSANDELLIFFKSKDENGLLGWEILKNKRREIKVVVSKTNKLNESLLKEKNYFIFSDDLRKKNQLFKGPFKRNIKKIPKHGKPQ